LRAGVVLRRGKKSYKKVELAWPAPYQTALRPSAAGRFFACKPKYPPTRVGWNRFFVKTNKKNAPRPFPLAVFLWDIHKLFRST
jgi:hypothetical protein